MVPAFSITGREQDRLFVDQLLKMNRELATVKRQVHELNPEIDTGPVFVKVGMFSRQVVVGVKSTDRKIDNVEGLTGPQKELCEHLCEYYRRSETTSSIREVNRDLSRLIGGPIERKTLEDALALLSIEVEQGVSWYDSEVKIRLSADSFFSI